MARTFPYLALSGLIVAAALVKTEAKGAASKRLGAPPAGFSSSRVNANGVSLHSVRGGRGPAVILLHGFPEDWVEYRAILSRLAERFTVVAVDLPGIGKSEPSSGGYETANLASHIHGLVKCLKLDRPYIVGHDLGGLVTYAYLRQFPDSLRGAMILDVPVPGLDGWDQAISGLWNVGFIQASGGLAEKLLAGRHAAFFNWCFDLGNFSREQRAYFIQSYGAPQLHAAFEIYRAFPEDARWNGAQIALNSVPLVVVVGENSFTAPLLSRLMEGYRAKGMNQVESARIPNAAHYVVADNPDAVAQLIERYALA